MKRLPGKGPRTAISRRRSTAPGRENPSAESSAPDDSAQDQESPPRLPAVQAAAATEGAPMSVREHLLELRNRLIHCIVAVLVGFFACYSFSAQLFDWLAAPLQDALNALPDGGTMMFTNATEGFMVDMRIALVAGVLLASPYVFYQLWSFVAPGLYPEERRNIIPLTMGSALLFLTGAAFCYFGAFPVAFKFFMSFTRPGIRAAITLDSYLGFSLRMILAFGIIFQMPLVSYFLAKIGLINAGLLRAWRKYAIVGNFIVAAIVTPPDIFSQLFMVGPLLLLYELSIWVCTLAKPGRRG